MAFVAIEADAEARFREAAHERCRRVLELLASDVVTLYPTLTEAYATKIARDRNAPRGGGSVTRFQVRRDFIRCYPLQDAGGREHLEYANPAEDLRAFNSAIVGQA